LGKGKDETAEQVVRPKRSKTSWVPVAEITGQARGYQIIPLSRIAESAVGQLLKHAQAQSHNTFA